MEHHGSLPGEPHPSAAPLDWVTWLRAVAILGVVSIHNAAANAAAPGARSRGEGQVGIWLDIPFVFVVPLFVMLSGALLLDPAKVTSSGGFLRRRAGRLVPPLLFWNTFYVVLLYTVWGDWPGSGEVADRVVTGRVTNHLYFFWIVLGLAALVPVLVPWLRNSQRREWVVVGAIACGVPVLTAILNAARGFTGSGMRITLETAWTWWLPYLGVFILGWALRGEVLRGRALGAAGLALVALLGLVGWQWRNPATPHLLDVIAGVHYYSPTVIALTVLVFLVGQATLRPGGVLGELVRPPVMRWVEPVGAATLGIYGLHVAILTLAIRSEWFGPGATSVPLLLLRYAAVAALTCALVLPLRRVPYLRRVL